MKLFLQIALLPIFLLYMFTFSLFIMPILYGKRKWGVIGYAPLWLINFFTVAWLQILFKWAEDLSSNMNKWANWCMGYETGWTVSHQLGKRINEGKASWVACLHCRILGTYDVAGWHCSPRAKSLL